jgi:hypothetical protein
MKPPRLLHVLTALNLALLAFLAVRARAVEAGPEPGVLRGKGLEIVDDQGRVRASIQVAPPDASVRMPDGSAGHPETVILRLITADGKPRVKLTTSDTGSGLMVLGDSDTTHAVLKAHRASSSLLLRDDEAKQKTLAP